MKRKNQKTGDFFKYGDVRSDGFIFRTYLNQIKKDGYNKEVWLSKDVFLDQHAAQKKHADIWKKKNSEKRRKFLNRVKMKYGCHSCGYRAHPAALDFDHQNQSEKRFTIGTRDANTSMEKLKEEIRKCKILCANCHRISSYENGHCKTGQAKHKFSTQRDEVLRNISSSTPKHRSSKSNNRSGVEGVNRHSPTGLWEASIMVKGKRYSLGRCNSMFEAVCLRKSAELLYANKTREELDK